MISTPNARVSGAAIKISATGRRPLYPLLGDGSWVPLFPTLRRRSTQMQEQMRVSALSQCIVPDQHNVVAYPSELHPAALGIVQERELLACGGHILADSIGLNSNISFPAQKSPAAIDDDEEKESSAMSADADSVFVLCHFHLMDSPTMIFAWSV